MTESALDPTPEHLLRLARLYLDTVGTVSRESSDRLRVEFDDGDPPELLDPVVDDGRLVVTVPSEPADSTADPRETPTDVGMETRRDTTARQESETNVVTLTADAEFTQRLLDSAAAHYPVGTASVAGIPGDRADAVPRWIRESPVRVVDVAFHPYYDAPLVCVWVRVAMETPSQYQRELLHAVVLDPETGERVDCDPTTLVAAADGDAGSAVSASRTGSGTSVSTASSGVSVSAAGSGRGHNLPEILDKAGDIVVDEVSDEIERVESAAGSAAADALETYVERKRERRAELRAELDRVESDLETVTERLQEGSTPDRVEHLERRETLTERRNELERDLSSLETAESSGFPDERERLRRRHAVTVRTRPVAATVLSVERGDLTLRLAADSTETTLDLSFGAGAGVRESPSCLRCETQYSVENGLRLTTAGVACDDCTDT